MKTSSILNETFSGPVSFKDFRNELLEAIEAATNRDVKNLLEELNQLVLFLYIFLYQIWEVDLEVPGWCSSQLKEDFRRFDIWKMWFERFNLTWSLSYFHHGNNPRRTSKVQLVLEEAGMKIDKNKADELAAEAVELLD